MPLGCVAYVIDNGYLLQALVSAAQARACVSRETADVVIICIDRPSPLHSEVSRIADDHGIELTYRDPAEIGAMHVMFGRLYLHRMLKEEYSRIVYIDGDTQIRGALDPLFSVDIPEGCFLACRDPAALFARLSTRWLNKIVTERREVGFTRPHSDYFNSGVLIIDRDSWTGLFARCVELLRERGEGSRYPDQDILNLAVGDRCRFISTRWNFPGFLIGSREESILRPVIYHFMSNPRPWNQAAPPWGNRWSQPYAEMLKDHPALRPLAPPKSVRQAARYWAQQSYKIAAEYRAVGLMREFEPDILI
jgi:lipopolysaccharide biosynthesis glycosyltransferase